MDIVDTQDELSERVAASVRHALALVGPAEGGSPPVSSEEQDAA